MIKAKELRIGNYIEYNGKARKVTALAENDIVIDGFAASEFNAISITYEMLKKVGFNYIDYWVKGEFEITENEDGFVLRVAEYKEGKTFCYLHQLQNLYFALTGEELEINL